MTNVNEAESEINRLQLLGALKELFGHEEEQYAGMSSQEILDSLDLLQTHAVFEFLGV